jgi:hypothetical protein
VGSASTKDDSLVGIIAGILGGLFCIAAVVLCCIFRRR